MSKAKDLISLMEMSIRLTSSDTGLDYDIWCPADDHIKKKAAPYIKICNRSSSNFNFNDSVEVTISPNKPQYLQSKKGFKKGGVIGGKVFNKCKKFIIQNYNVLMKHWNGDISDSELLKQIVKV